MKQKTFLIITFLFLVCFNGVAQDWDRFAVVLGEKNLNDTVEEKDNNCRVVSIRIDGEGNYYPNFYISDRSLKKSKGKLSKWYNSHPIQYKEILKSYSLKPAWNSIDKLNKAIAKNYKASIDSLSENRVVVFLIHGYRKQMYKKKDNSLSMVDNDLVEAELGTDKVFVEVYWDSKHIRAFKGLFGKRGLKMMKASAIPNAKKVGLRLRSLVNALNKTELVIISHSLGSVVSNALTFDYKHNSKLMDGKHIKTIHLGPAIGYEDFDRVNLRGNGAYHLSVCVGYNVNDWVLLKDFGRFNFLTKSNPTTFGDTSLGCNFNSQIDKLKKQLANKLSPKEKLLTKDMSGERNHLFSYYARHSSFKDMLNFIDQ